MENLKQCKNGHFYDMNLPSCPHCPKDEFQNREDMSSYNDTILEGTSAFGDGTILEDDLSKTKPMEEFDSASKDDTDMNYDITKTHIKLDNPDAPNYSEGQAPRANRMLVGWLVSYTLDDMGRDFRLYEGRNTIGTKPTNDVVVLSDPSISGHNTTILFRGNRCFIRDELSTNGTKLDETEILPNEVPELKDGSIIHVGDTLFKFRSAL